MTYPGGEGKVGVIDPWNIAAVAAAALTQDGHEGQAYALSGPEVLSMGDMVQTIARQLGKPVQYVYMEDSAAGEMMLKAGLPAHAVEGLVTAFTAMRAGRFAYLTDDVETITGCKPRSFEVWCGAHIAAFQE